MKKILFIVILFSITKMSSAQITRVEYEVLTHYQSILANRNIISRNTSIEKYTLFGDTYFLITGEAGKNFDDKPLLVRILPNGYKEIQNLYTIVFTNIDPATREYYRKKNRIYIFDKGIYANFFQRATFVEYLWKKYPEDECWDWVY